MIGSVKLQTNRPITPRGVFVAGDNRPAAGAAEFEVECGDAKATRPCLQIGANHTANFDT